MFIDIKKISAMMIMLFISIHAQPIIIDHTCTDLSKIPETWINQVRQNLKVWYGHTSHGSQLVTGMETIQSQYGEPYTFNYEGSDGALSLEEEYGDLGHVGDLTWRDQTLDALKGYHADRNVIVWSWCGGASDNTQAGIQTYLDAMNQLETDYPGRTFVYMTGHLDGSGVNGTLNRNNNQIRQFCQNNNRVLFDFADIESYDPDGNYFLNRGADDNCDYDGGNWATAWCAAHPGSALCADCECAHSQALNCNLKGRAFWWLLARIAGWDGGSGDPDPQPATPKYEVSPATLNFGVIQTGTSKTLAFRITNSDTPVVHIDSIRIAGDGFVIALIQSSIRSTLIPAFDMAAGFMQDVNVTFEPNVAGQFTATVAIHSSQAGNKTVQVSGSAWTPSTNGANLHPQDLVYQGAFRLPDGPDEYGWLWCGEALTYCPTGDPGGPDDGYPGSLFGVGHNWNTWVSEISIPAPVISPTKNVEDLPTAATLQPFANIRGGLYESDYFEIPRVGLEYLDAQREQNSGKLYFCWADHMGETDTHPTVGWCDSDLSAPNSQGLWDFGGLWNYVTTDYIFAIPQAWADAHTPGLRLVAGRYRDGGQGAQGPSMYAFGPWKDGNPPVDGASLSYTTLLEYGDVYTEGNPTMTHYHHSDEWNGGAWLTAGDKSAVVFAGTKGKGDCWYGLIDGTVWEEPYPAGLPDSLVETRGWWSDTLTAQMIFYNPADLASVAAGTKETWEPQPYAVMEIDDMLYKSRTHREKYHVGAPAFDPVHGHLFVIEQFGDGDKILIHVWNVVGGSGSAVRSDTRPTGFRLMQNYPNPFNPRTAIRYQLSAPGRVKLEVVGITGRIVRVLVDEAQAAGIHQVMFDASELASGVYQYRLQVDGRVETRKMVVLE